MTAAERDAAQRREARDLRIASQRRLLRIRAIAAVVLVTAFLGGCLALYRSPVFRVTRVEVLGAGRSSAQRIRVLARVPRDATLIRFPADEVAARVAVDPWVRSVSVSRVFPNGMRIRVIERTPVAMVDGGADFWLIDADGMVIAKRSADQTSTAIVIRDVPGLDAKPGRTTTSEPLLSAIAVIDGISAALRREVRSVSAPSIDGTTLYTEDRVEIVFGSAEDIAKKDMLVRRILGEQAGKVVSIDVRTTDRPTWRGLSK